jgi:uncharacterized oligopeptide transporter (OPT) family protein
MGSLQSAVLGFGLFKTLQRFRWGQDFTVAECVIVQTTAVATATMPLAAGLVGVIPAMVRHCEETRQRQACTLKLWPGPVARMGTVAAVDCCMLEMCRAS